MALLACACKNLSKLVEDILCPVLLAKNTQVPIHKGSCWHSHFNAEKEWINAEKKWIRTKKKEQAFGENLYQQSLMTWHAFLKAKQVCKREVARWVRT